MTIADILGLEKIFGGSIDLEKKTFELKFLGFSIKGIKYSGIKELIKDTNNTEKILSGLFNRKQVMWQDFAREDVNLCLHSLEDLKLKCDNESKKFSATKKEKDKFFASLLIQWADQCDVATKEFLTAKTNEEISRGEPDPGDYLPAYKEIPEILGNFRARTLPIIKELSKLLPDDNPVRKETENNINFAIDIIVKYYRISPNQIQDGEYLFADVNFSSPPIPA